MEALIDGQLHKAKSPDELRAEGYRVRVRHLRYLDKREHGNYTIGAIPRIRYHGLSVYPRGGVTHVIVLAPDHMWAEATVRCSDQDSFVKRTGYVLAVEKAMKGLAEARRLDSSARLSRWA